MLEQKSRPSELELLQRQEKKAKAEKKAERARKMEEIKKKRRRSACEENRPKEAPFGGRQR